MNGPARTYGVKSTIIVVVAILGVAVGFAIGLLVNYRVKKSDWVEASGTWVGALASIIAVIIAARVFLSEEFRGDREFLHQQQAQLRREQDELQEAKRQAMLVQVGASAAGVQDGHGQVRVNQIFVDIHNRAWGPLTDLAVSVDIATTVERTPEQVLHTNSRTRAVLVPQESLVVPQEADPQRNLLGGMVTVTFGMDGRHWRRVGFAGVEQV